MIDNPRPDLMGIEPFTAALQNTYLAMQVHGADASAAYLMHGVASDGYVDLTSVASYCTAWVASGKCCASRSPEVPRADRGTVAEKETPGCHQESNRGV